MSHLPVPPARPNHEQGSIAPRGAEQAQTPVLSKAGAYCPSWFDRSAFDHERERLQARWGRPLRLHDDLDSTQDAAFDAFRAGAPSGALFVSHQQTKGRGRRGQTWQTAPGDCLTFSLLVRASQQLSGLAGLSLSVGLALVEGLAALVPKADLKLKWPNDVYLNNKKLAGILIESKQLKHERALVIGIGLNTSWTTPPPTLNATSLKAEGADYPGDPLLLAQLLPRLEERISTTLSQGLLPLLPSLRAVDFLQGLRFHLDDFSLREAQQEPALGQENSLWVQGVGIAEDGCLLVEPLKSIDSTPSRIGQGSALVRDPATKMLKVQAAHIRLEAKEGSE